MVKTVPWNYRPASPSRFAAFVRAAPAARRRGNCTRHRRPPSPRQCTASSSSRASTAPQSWAAPRAAGGSRGARATRCTSGTARRRRARARRIGSARTRDTARGTILQPRIRRNHRRDSRPAGEIARSRSAWSSSPTNLAPPAHPQQRMRLPHTGAPRAGCRQRRSRDHRHAHANLESPPAIIGARSRRRAGRRCWPSPAKKSEGDARVSRPPNSASFAIPCLDATMTTE